MISEFCYDWNEELPPLTFRGIVDETLRDGMQAPNAPSLSLEEKVDLIGCMHAVGIHDAIVGMIGLGQTSASRTRAVLKALAERRWNVTIWLLSRCVESDLKELSRLQDDTGCPLGMNIFVNLSGIRCFVEGSDVDDLLRRMTQCLKVGTRIFGESRVAFEDATRTSPDVLQRAIGALSSAPPTRLAITDTAGIATPDGVKRLCTFVRDAAIAELGDRTALEWHGHEDRGLGLANSLESLRCGFHYIHGTILGIGERNGNVSLDALLLNLSAVMPEAANWPALLDYYAHACRLFPSFVSASHPFLGENSFLSSTGTHCAAIDKALELGRPDVASELFSPRSYVSGIRRARFGISHLSGHRTVRSVLQRMGIETTNAAVGAVLSAARALGRTMTDAEIARAAQDCRKRAGRPEEAVILVPEQQP